MNGQNGNLGVEQTVTRYSLLIFTLTLPLLALSQVKQSWLITKIQKSDSVLLVSHQEREGSSDIMVDSADNETPYPKLFVGGNLNYQIVKEKTSLAGKQLDTLIQILSRPFQDKMISEGKCFKPHHSIFLMKNRVVRLLLSTSALAVGTLKPRQT